MSGLDAVLNIGGKVARRLTTAHKPVVRFMRRRERQAEHDAYAREAADLEREIARVADGSGPILAGPWLAEVGYEVLYWIPFLRWFLDAHRVAPERLFALSRGGMDAAYEGIAGRYVDIFDLLAPEELVARNAARQAEGEGGGQKQSGRSALDEELIAAAAPVVGADASVLHPAMMFGLFRHAWHGHLPMDFFWRRTCYTRVTLTPDALPSGLRLPDEFAVAKVYTGPALGSATPARAAVRALIARTAARLPVVLLETPARLDEHRDFTLDDLPGVISAAPWMAPRHNLAVQLALISRARLYVGTCGGLAWLAPFAGVPTVALYDDDRLLATHLLVARQAGKRAGAAEFAPLDLRALARLDAAIPAVE